MLPGICRLEQPDPPPLALGRRRRRWSRFQGAGLTTPRYLYTDHQGSIVAATDGAGVPAVINTYDEYGIPGLSNAGRFQYTGQVWLDELGMYYYKARIYSPTLGRFLQTDPVGYQDQFNLYAYVGNDPVNSIDPTGMFRGQFASPEAARTMIPMINENATGVYGADNQGMLVRLGDAPAGHGSVTYDQAVGDLIASPIDVLLNVADTVLANGTFLSVQQDGGGGVTAIDFNAQGGVAGMSITVNGQPQTDIAVDVNGAPLAQSAADVLMHEIATEALPFASPGATMTTPRSFNVENQARNELGKPGRGRDASHRNY